jgi:transposase
MNTRSEIRYKKRVEVVEAVQRGEQPAVVARVHNIPLRTVFDWLARYRNGGWDALKDKPRSGRPRKVNGKVMCWLYDVITRGHPDQYQFDFCLWTLNIIRSLLEEQWGISLSKSSISRLLWQMGLSPQRPIFKAVQQDPKAVDAYLRKRYPELREQARRNGAEIVFVDEAAFRSDHHSGTTWGPIGKTPVIGEHRGRFGYNAIRAVSANGKMYFEVFDERMDQSGFISFLQKLCQDIGRPTIVITDRASYHTGKEVKAYVTATEGKLTLEFLPARSPELNPSEQVWNRAKNRLGRMIIRNKAEMENLLTKTLDAIQSSINIVKSFFRLEHTRYAAAIG